MKQLGRFLRLERARKDSEREIPLPPRRFATLEAAVAPAPRPEEVSHPVAGLERFAPAPEPSLELEAPDGAEPFIRCVRCGADSIRHAMVCRQCEARLDSDEVRTFNVRLWADITAARDREAQELRHREALRGGVADIPDAQGLAAEFDAREQVRHSLETPSWRDSSLWGWPSTGGAPALRLLVGLAMAIPALLFLFRRGSAGLGAALLAGLAVLLLLAFRRLR